MRPPTSSTAVSTQRPRSKRMGWQAGRYARSGHFVTCIPLRLTPTIGRPGAKPVYTPRSGRRPRRADQSISLRGRHWYAEVGIGTHKPSSSPNQRFSTEKSLKAGVFFVTRKHASKTPRFTINSPRSHQQNTTSKHPLFPKPPRKQPKNNKKLSAATPGFFSAKTRGLGLENGLEEQTDSHHP